MKSFIIMISGATCISIAIVGCAKHIPPTTVAGQECVRAAEQVKRACENERIYAIQACNDRNNQRDQIFYEQIERQLQNGEISADLARTKRISVAVNKEESCQALTAHCRNQYESHFLACGGRVE